MTRSGLLTKLVDLVAVQVVASDSQSVIGQIQQKIAAHHAQSDQTQITVL
jgi:hypothetical protein